MTHKSIVNLKCCLQDGEDKISYIISPCKEDKVAILEFAVKTLLANQDYQALSFNFNLYVNDSKEDKLMKSTEEISKYFDKPLVPDQIHIFIGFRSVSVLPYRTDRFRFWYGKFLLIYRNWSFGKVPIGTGTFGTSTDSTMYRTEVPIG